MAEAVIVESQPTVDVSVGPLVGITSEQRQEFKKTGELPKVEPKEPPKTEEAASSSEPEQAKPAGDSEPPKQEKTERKAKGKTADERIAELEATIEKIRKGAGKETKAESSPAPQPEYTRPKPTIDDKDDKGAPKYVTYEDYIEDLADWKGEQRDFKNKKEQREREQRESFNSKMAEARTRYENFDSVKDEFVEAIGVQGFDPVVHAMLNDSEVLPDLVFTIGSSKEDLAAFVEMAKTNPGKALRYIALTESLIADELAKPKHEAPEKPKTQAPKPPSEAGGRAAAPPDALDAAAQANDFRAFKAEATRRQLAKLKG